MVQICSQQLCILLFHPAVAADVKIIALVDGDNAEVFALVISTFTGVAADGAFKFMRRIQPFITTLKFDREADAVLDSVAAPSGTGVRFDRAQGFAVRVTEFKSGSDKSFFYQ